MKATFMLLAISAMLLAPALMTAETIHDQLNGTWSGSWIPEGGVRNAMTIELKYEESGKLSGRFVSPVSMNFTKATFNGSDVSIEALVPESVRRDLTARGHSVTVIPARTGTFGHGQAVMANGAGVHFGASEPRHDGAAIPQPAPVFEREGD